VTYHSETLQRHILGFIVGGEDLTADVSLKDRRSPRSRSREIPMTGSSKDLPTTFLSTSRTSFGQSISGAILAGWICWTTSVSADNAVLPHSESP